MGVKSYGGRCLDFKGGMGAGGAGGNRDAVDEHEVWRFGWYLYGFVEGQEGKNNTMPKSAGRGKRGLLLLLLSC